MEIILSVIEHSSWPILVLIVMIVYYKEIRKLLERLRILKAGAVEIQLNEKLHNQGLSQEQITLIMSLSHDELDIFLFVSYDDSEIFRFKIPMFPHIFKNKMFRLQDAGLIEITNPEDSGENLKHKITSVGRRVRALLINSMTSLLRQAI